MPKFRLFQYLGFVLWGLVIHIIKICDKKLLFLTLSRPFNCVAPDRLKPFFRTLYIMVLYITFFSDRYIMGSPSTKWTIEFFAKNYLCVFFWELHYLITVLIFQKNLKSLQSIFEANPQEKKRLFFHYGIVESAAERIILNRGLYKINDVESSLLLSVFALIGWRITLHYRLNTSYVFNVQII